MVFSILNGNNYMFVFIDESIKSPFCENTNIALSNLANAHRSGNHFIFAKSSVLKDIFENADIHQREKSIYQTLFSQVAQFGMLKQNLSTYILVTSSSLCAQHIDINNQLIIRTPIDTFLRFDSLTATSIIGENINDAKFYALIAKAYAKKQTLNYKIKYFPVNGGGTQTGNTYKNHQDNKKISFCIVDSDEKAKACSIGSTAKGVKSMHRSNGLNNYHIISVHEAENLIPLTIIDELSQTSDQKAAYQKITNNKKQEFINHIDYKLPLTFLNILNNDKSCYRKYWLAQISLLQPEFMSQPCYKMQKCKNSNTELTCECILFESFGTNILERSIESLEKKSILKQAEACLSIVNQQEWENISNLILAWGFAPPGNSA